MLTVRESGRMMRWSAGILALIAMSASAFGQSRFETGGAQIFAGSEPNSLVIVGTITGDTSGRFLQALRENPQTKTIELLSSGGLVLPALSIAWEIHERGLRTRIPEGSLCYSACAYMFLAGAGREVKGELGVHQFWGESDGAGAQLSFNQAEWNAATIRDAMRAFGVAPEVERAMFDTPSAEIYIFSRDEIDRFGIEREAAAPVMAEFEEWPALGITRMTKSLPASADARYRTEERVVEVSDDQAGDLWDVMMENGIAAGAASAITQIVADVDPAIASDPGGAELRILWGPFQSLPVSVPYRVSVFRPTAAGARHIATAALSDAGTYVVGVNPGDLAQAAPTADGKGPRAQN